MPEKRPKRRKVRLAQLAQLDVKAILKWSEEEFGAAAALRYKTLIRQAIVDIGHDPERPGSAERSEMRLAGVRTYHLSFSRSRVNGPSVKDPRHFLAYRIGKDGVVEIARVIHDSRDLRRHLAER